MRLEQMHNRNIVKRYADLLACLSKQIRRELTDSDKGYLSADEEEILKICEDTFFKSELSEAVAVKDVDAVIGNLFRRVRNKYGILYDLLEDESVNEIMINGPDRIFVEKNRQLTEVDDSFISADELEETIRMLAADVHREVNDASPIVDARLPNGYRVNGVLQAVALNGPILTIRKFADEEITLRQLEAYGSVTCECADVLRSLVRAGYNIFISGGTSSGKTTFLNALAMEIEHDERVIIIEDSAELKISSIDNKVHMECRSANSVGKGEVNMQNLIKTSLRMRPDRIIVGEVRGREVVDMIQAMNTGHDGSMSTGHGNSIKGMLNRLETMYLMDAQIPVYSIKSQIANAIDIFVHLKRDSASRRSVVEVAELSGFDGTDYVLNYLFEENEEGKLVRTSNKLIDDARLRRLIENDRSKQI